MNVLRKISKGVLATILVVGSLGAASAEKLRVAVVGQTTSAATFHLANVLGYFKEEGLDVEISKFDGASLLVTALVSGAVDVATVGYTAAFFNTAKNGDLKVIAAGGREVPGFSSTFIIASNEAYAAGLKTAADLRGKRIAVNTLGTAIQYSALLIAKKYGFDKPPPTFVALGSHPNITTAVKTNAVDAGVTLSPLAAAAEARGEGKVIAKIGDETPWTLSAIFTRGSVIDKRGDELTKFLRAVYRATQVYDATFQQRDASGKPVFGKDADKYIEIVSKAIDVPVDSVRASLVYFEPTMDIDPAELTNQISTWTGLGMVDGGVTAASVLNSTLLQKAKAK